MISKDLLTLQESDVIRYEWQDDHLALVTFGAEWAEGRIVHCDYEKLEFQLACNHLYGAVHISLESAQMLKFKNELFHNNNCILEIVAEIVPQVPLPPTALHNIQSDEKIQSGHTSNTLEALAMVIGSVRATGVAEPNMLILDYMENILVPTGQLHSSVPRELRTTSMTQCRLNQLVGLFEVIEDMTGDVAIQSMQNIYKVPLGDQEMRKTWEIVPSTIPAETLHQSLRQLAIRYLTVDHALSPEVDLKTAFKSCSSTDKFERLPDELQVKHVFFLIEMIKRKIAESTRSTVQTRSQTRKPTNSTRVKRF
eukprot:c20598_g1_i3.p1 GENE.c20598_g1_i3~~c20598_g1_i3.p1  ORF type:complete len:310 (+),score=53.16 c20598_g1_i3:435-1364(+)